VLGALIIGGLPAVLQNVGWISSTNTIAWQTVIYGLALTAMMVLRPSGLLPEGAGIGPLIRRLRSATSGPATVRGLSPEVAVAGAAVVGGYSGIDLGPGSPTVRAAN